MEFRSINQMRKIIFESLPRFPKNVDLVVGIPRSGLLPATMLSMYLNKPLVDFDGYLSDRVFDVGATKKRRNVRIDSNNSGRRNVIIIDDSVRTGHQMTLCKQSVKELGRDRLDNIFWMSIFITPDSKKFVDLYLNVCKLPRIFEWNMMSSYELKFACMDIDDVITDMKNRNGKTIKHLEPLYIPKMTVNHLVTCRIESQREDTVNWLKKYGIKYNNLHMMNYKTIEERKRKGNHAQYKAEIYTKTKSRIFIESSLKQSRDIAKISKKPVICITDMKLYKG